MFLLKGRNIKWLFLVQQEPSERVYDIKDTLKNILVEHFYSKGHARFVTLPVHALMLNNIFSLSSHHDGETKEACYCIHGFKNSGTYYS